MSSSRRRKPLVTRKVLSDEEDDINSTNDEDSRMTNGDSQNKDDDIPEDLPEGTVVVEPEPVEESAFKGPEFPSSKKKVLEATGYLATVNCSACGDQINTSKKGDARRHPELSVLICKRCYKFHTSGVIKQDEDGLDEYCRWCSEGGNLFGCDYCHNAFCQACIKRNLGRAEFSKVKEADKFKCYVCDPAPLAAMVEQCNSVLDMISKEYEKLNESLKKKKDAEKQKSTSKSDSKDKTKEEDKSKTTTNKSLVIKLPGMGPKTSTPKSTSVSATVKIPSTNSLLAPGMIKYPAININASNTNFVRQATYPKQSLAPMYNNTSKQNIIFVEPTKGSAKQLVYVQPKPHNVPMMSSVPPSQQARNPLNWTNVTAKNVPFITDQLMQSTNELLSLLKSVRINVQGSSSSLSNIAFEGRMTAITCMKSGVDLFLGQLSSIVGTDIVQANASKTMLAPTVPSQPSQSAGVKLTGGNSSLMSTSEKDLIVLDSDDSRMEVEDVTDSDKGNNSEKDTASCDIISIESKDINKHEDKSNDKDKKERKEDSVVKEDKSSDKDKKEKKEDSLVNGDKNVEISEDKTSEESNESEDIKNSKSDESKSDVSKKSKSDESKSDVSKKSKSDESKTDVSKKSKSDESRSDVSKKPEKKNDKESDYESSTEAENDAAHLELLQELQELSGAIEEKKEENEEEKSKDKKEGKQKNEKEDEKSKDKKEGKQKKEQEKSKEKKEGKQKKEDEKSSNKKEGKQNKEDEKLKDKKEGKQKKENEKSRARKESSEKNEKKKDDNESSDDSSSSGSESDDEDSDNSKDSDFNVKSERRTRRSDMKASEKKKFQDLRNKRKEKERSAKKKAKEEKKKKGSDESDFDDELEDEIDKLEKDPVIKKGKKKKEKEEEDKGKSKKEKKTEKKKDEKSTKEKKKGTDLDDLSSTEEDNVEEDDEEEDKENEEVPMDADDGDATEDLSAAENEDVMDDSSDSEIVLSPRKQKKGDKKKGKSESGSNTEEEEVISPKKKRLRSSLLDAKLSDSESDFQPVKKRKKRKASSSEDKSDNSSDSDNEFIALGKKGKGKKKKNQKKKDGTGKKRKRIKKVDSSDEGGEDSANETDADSDELEEMKNKKKRKRKKKGEEDSEEDQDEDDDGSPSKAKRKDIRKLITSKKLKDTTKAASRAEEERRERIREKQRKYNNIIQEVDESSPTKCPITKQLILEREDKTNEPILEVDQDLVAKLKPHQVEAVEFLWNCTVESLKMLKEDKTEGAGCILAHCMGLGKTLSVIAFLHTMMGNYETTEFSTALIVCPLNTVLNWQSEVKMWLEKNEVQLEVHELASVKVNESRARMLEEWHEDGGIMIIGYEMFRNLSQGSNCKNKRIKASFKKCLMDPGPDFVVCDEGHILKNDASALSKAMMQIKTRRRIVLTGTPLQNNLVEYHCMVNFVKPNLLGTRKEFLNRFVNPITNGQCTDSSSHDVRLMKRRAHILHEKLAGCVQRKDYSALTKYLPPKQEYVIAVRLANVQCDLYSKYLEIGGYSGPGDMGKSKGAKLFSDYQALMRIWTHPWVLKMAEVRQEMKNMFDDESSFIDDTDTSQSESEAKSTSAAGSASDNSFNSGSEEESKKKKKGKKESEEEPTKESFAGEIVKKWKTRSRGEYNDEDFERMDKIETPFSTGWWADYVKEEDQFKMELGGKLMLLFEILRMCEEIGDKVLIFSQSLLSLDLIEAYLDHVDSQYDELLNNKDKDKKDDDKEKEDKKEENDKPEAANTDEMFGKTWLKGQDYLRMDGSTSAPLRADMAKNFNNPDNYRLRLFLISTKAGGLGINLVAANRVIIFDASWNPSHDVQSIFRVYRFGQTKPVYVYRFLAQGTMEEKIYERQVTKQSLAQRVIDEHQIDRHFDSNDLRELYIFKPDRLDDPNRTERPTPALPKDTLLAELLTNKKDWIVGYHEHDSLLENKIDQELSEEERKAAWEEFENEKKGLINTVQQRVMGMPNPNFGYQFGAAGMPGMGGMSPQLNQENLLRIVQEMKSKFPHLPQEQLTMQVQNVIRNMISRQIQQQQWEQRRQLDHRELQQQQQLQQLQNRIMMQQNQLRMQQQAPGRGMNMPLSGIQPQTSSSASSSQSLLASTLMNGKPQNQPSTSKKKS
ncbi:transcriptional regulator ATRX homolog isoform X2 [Mytilus edulis]|uniref:transcriptional regulator ATRX homolog isoform X2 n=1 Tax=Mytilus edulis TaxID=6550 RepID=UPI0039F10E29